MSTLKRKNEDDSDRSADDQLNKRVALDSEQPSDADEKLREETPTAAPIAESPKRHENGIKIESDESFGAMVAAEPLETPANGNLDHPAAEQLLNGAEYPPLLNGAESARLQGKTNAPATGLKPAQAHREKDEVDYVLLRMYCPVKEAGIVVGKKGEKITHIREKAGVRIHVSENVKSVPERIITVKGTAENAARAFGLITRTILDEPEDEPALMMSKQYVLKLLIPHAVIGFVIGKSGLKFREIEKNSAAQLKAAEQPLPFSTDRVLLVSGVGDAIHIAVYYISQVILEHRDSLKKNKVVYYNPVNCRPQQPMAPGPLAYVANPGLPGMPGMPGMSEPLPYQKPYEMQMMFQPPARPSYVGPLNMPHASGPVPGQIPPQSLYTDEHGNTIVGDVITNTPVQISTGPDRFTQDVFVANFSIGSVIGKGGQNIKQIRESSGCNYVKIEPDQHQLILLGGGRGLTNIRRLTLTGTYQAIQTAIYFINQRILADKERNGVQ